MGLGGGSLIFYAEKLDKSDRNGFEKFNKCISYVFLGLLIMLAGQSIFPEILYEMETFYLIIATSTLGVVTLYFNIEYIEKRLNSSLSLYLLCLCTILIFYLYQSFYIAKYARLQVEDGTYLYTSILVYKNQIPILDFFNGPGVLWPYIYGLPQYLFGPDLMMGRITSVILMIANLILVSAIACKLQGRLAGILAPAIIAINPINIHYLSLINSYPLAIFFMLASFFILFKNPTLSLNIIISCILMTMAVATRLHAIFALMLLLLANFIINKNYKKKWIYGLTTCFILLTLFFGIVALIDVNKFVFNIFGRINPDYTQTFYKNDLADPIPVKLKTINDLFQYYSIEFISFFFISLIGIYNLLIMKDRFISLFTKNYQYFILIFSIFFIAFFSFSPVLTNFTYFSLISPLIAIVLSCFLVIILHYSKSWTKILVAFYIMAIFASTIYIEDRLVYNSSPIDEVSLIGNYLKNNTEEKSKIFTMFTPVLIQSERMIVPESMVRGYFSFSPFMPTLEAESLGLVNTEMLVDAINNQKASAIILDDAYFYRRISLDTEPFEKINNAIFNNYYAKDNLSIVGIGNITIYFPLNKSGLN